MKHYEAPWSTSFIVMSVLTTVVCLGASAGAWLALVGIGVLIDAAGRDVGAAAGAWLTLVGKHLPGVLGFAALLPLVLLFGTALFTIRGYSIASDCILVHRLLWSTRLPRAGLESAQAEPDAMRGSLRTFGNGGAFSFTGFYYNKRLGSYRAYVTDPQRTVVLRYANRRVVLSPATPEDFVRDLALAKPSRPNSPFS
jgi:hypothetical protein